MYDYSHRLSLDFGSFFAPWIAGATICVVNLPGRFSAKPLLDAIVAEKVLCLYILSETHYLDSCLSLLSVSLSLSLSLIYRIFLFLYLS